MRIVTADLYALNIPFAETFRHALCARNDSDSVVVKLTTDEGVSGYGEGLPRPYVTGEDQASSVACIRTEWVPRALGFDVSRVGPDDAMAAVDRQLSRRAVQGGVTWNASRAAVEIAMLDCVFRSHGVSIGDALRPFATQVTYSGIIGVSDPSGVERAAQRCREAGFSQVKIKVSSTGDVDAIARVRDLLGPDVSIRLDANAAFTPSTALPFIEAVARYDIACIEQPIPHAAVEPLATLRAASPIPLMADESLVTMADADALIAADAVDAFNLRISKCGGLGRTLAIYERARAAGVAVQLGCHVGETAILSAAGRHLAAHLVDPLFVEGSYSALLLERDIAQEPVTFGHAGCGPLLRGAGLGITVCDERLEQYADRVVSLKAE